MGSLVEDMRKMLSDNTFSDMVFLCGEGEDDEVPASRLLVAAHSPTLRSMLLTSGMAKTKLSRVPLPTIDPSTMHICMEFFYTGVVEDRSWRGLCSTMKVVSAGKFFLNPKLVELAISRLAQCDCLHDEESFVDLARAYSFAVELQLHGDANMIPVIEKFNTWLFFDAYLFFRCYSHLSEHALVLLSQQTDQHGSRCTGTWACTYLMFHVVVHWCISNLFFGTEQCISSLLFGTEQSRDPSIAKTSLFIMNFKKFLPQSKVGVYKRVAMRVDDKRNAITPSLSKLLLSKFLAAPVGRCLKLINLDLSKIPGQILGKIIEPLDIVPAEMILAAYRQQAMSIPLK